MKTVIGNIDLGFPLFLKPNEITMLCQIKKKKLKFKFLCEVVKFSRCIFSFRFLCFFLFLSACISIFDLTRQVCHFLCALIKEKCWERGCNWGNEAWVFCCPKLPKIKTKYKLATPNDFLVKLSKIEWGWVDPLI